jgi:antitoxin component of RelBE/YafQ-DinJ toxin-antitoxin module
MKTEAIRMFYTQITLRNGLPFDVAIPNDETIKALEDSRSGRDHRTAISSRSRNAERVTVKSRVK